MSTKTTFKRVALVAVAALGLGVLSVAPSSAAQTAAQSYIFCSKADGGDIANSSTTGATCGGVAGSSNYVTLTSVSQAKDIEITVAGSTFATEETGFVINTAGTVATLAGGSAAKKIRVLTPSAGTITVSVKTATAGSGVFSASTETVVITVGATALSGVYSAAKSSVYLVAGETWTATADATTAPTNVKTYVATDSATASIVVKYLDGLEKPITGDSITATITSGPGTLFTANQRSGYVGKFDTVTALTANFSSDESVAKYSIGTDVDASTGVAAFFLYANGQAGTSVVTIKNSAGTVLGTKSVVFTDTTIASITATTVKPTVQGDTTGHTDGVFKLILKDSEGRVITKPSAYPTVTSSNSALATATQGGTNDTATAGADGDVYWGITPAAAASYGKVTITFTAGTVTATADVTLSSAVAATFTGSAANTVANGDVIYTFTAKDANGYAVPEGLALSNYIASVTSVGTAGSLASQTALTSTSKGGVWTTTAVSAPSSTTEITSTFVMTGTKGTANSYLAKTLTGIELPVTFSVANPSIDAATDAANEATDAANAATDAALAAADAADAATAAAEDASAAVAALAKSVNTALKNLKKQITSLTALVNKLLRK